MALLIERTRYLVYILAQEHYRELYNSSKYSWQLPDSYILAILPLDDVYIISLKEKLKKNLSIFHLRIVF